MDVQFKPKAQGIRIRHKTLRGVLLVVRDQKRPIPNPHNYKLPICSTCKVPHDVKTYHLKLDDEGTIIVSKTIYEKLSALDDKAGFETANTVNNPPTQTLQVPIAKQLVQVFDIKGEEKINATN